MNSVAYCKINTAGNPNKVEVTLFHPSCAPLWKIFSAISLEEFPFLLERFIREQDFEPVPKSQCQFHPQSESSDLGTGYIKLSFQGIQPVFLPIAELYAILLMVSDCIIGAEQYLLEHAESSGKTDWLNALKNHRLELVKKAAQYQHQGSWATVSLDEVRNWLGQHEAVAGIRFSFKDEWLPTMDTAQLIQELDAVCSYITQNRSFEVEEPARIVAVNYLKIGRFWGTNIPKDIIDPSLSPKASLSKVINSYEWLLAFSKQVVSPRAASQIVSLDMVPLAIDWHLNVFPKIPEGIDFQEFSTHCIRLFEELPFEEPGYREAAILDWNVRLHVDWVGEERLGFVNAAFLFELD
jgi:hypothetical protein